jgi:hypothetical protein
MMIYQHILSNADTHTLGGFCLQTGIAKLRSGAGMAVYSSALRPHGFNLPELLADWQAESDVCATAVAGRGVYSAQNGNSNAEPISAIIRCWSHGEQKAKEALAT